MIQPDSPLLPQGTGFLSLGRGAGRRLDDDLSQSAGIGTRNGLH